MTWLLAFIGPASFGVAVFAQTTGGGTSLTEALVAFGVITGLSGAVVKLWAENQRLQVKLEDMVGKTLPALGEAIAEMRETRRERERVSKVLDRIGRALDRIDPPSPSSRRRE